LAATGEAFGSIRTELMAIGGALTDPLGISIGDVSDTTAVAADQGIATSTLTNMASLFGSPFAAFCYLVFVLLYAPCVAVLGAITKEAGLLWMVLVFSWCTGLAYAVATVIYQAGTFVSHPLFSSVWIFAMISILAISIANLKKLAHRVMPSNLIEVVQIRV
jgi:ferrous iron transport protein B